MKILYLKHKQQKSSLRRKSVLACLHKGINIFQILFWIYNFFMVIFLYASYPVQFIFSPNYPYNHLKGRICSGYGIHRSNITEKEFSAHVQHIIVAFIYIINILWISGMTSRFLNKVSPNETGAAFNGNYRFDFVAKIKILRNV